MFSTDLSTILAVIVVVFGFLVVGIAVSQHNLRRDMHDWAENMRNELGGSVSRARMAEVECALTELSDSYTTLLGSFKKLRSRQAARDRRAAPQNELDSESEAGQLARKQQLRLEAKQKGLL